MDRLTREVRGRIIIYNRAIHYWISVELPAIISRTSQGNRINYFQSRKKHHQIKYLSRQNFKENREKVKDFALTTHSHYPERLECSA